MYSLTKDLKEPKFVVGIFTIHDFLSDEDILILKEAVKHKNLQKSLTNNNPLSIQYENSALARNNYITWIDYDKQNNQLCSVFKKIYSKIVEVNNERFKFNLTDVEPFQYTSYGKGNYYKKHMDLDNELSVGNTQRKLSFTIQLSDPKEYKGGELCVYVSENYVTANKQKGTISFFPSFLLHEVKEVTEGKRVSLVGWVWGPRFV